jgi:uncharacterized protein (TIGR02266 family)
MADYWIGDAEGRVLGPVSLDVIHELVSSGRLTRVTRASRDGQIWGTPESFPEVMALLLHAPRADDLLQNERQEAARVREQLRTMDGRPAHEIFRLDRNASVDAYRNAFFKLVKRFYPDRVRAQAHPELRKAYSDAFHFLSRLMVHIERELAAGSTVSAMPAGRAGGSHPAESGDEPLTPIPGPAPEQTEAPARPMASSPHRVLTPPPGPHPGLPHPPHHQSRYSYLPHEFVGFQRREDRVEVTVQVNARNSRMFTDHPLANLKTGGFYLSCGKSLPLGTLVDVVFRFENETREVRSRGRVILENIGGDPTKPTGFGVRFITLVEQDRSFMQQFVERVAAH